MVKDIPVGKKDSEREKLVVVAERAENLDTQY